MLKSEAISLLGGDVSSAAKAIGVTYQAVEKWPDVLPERIADRVVAALARKQRPESLRAALSLAYGPLGSLSGSDIPADIGGPAAALSPNLSAPATGAGF